MGYFKNTTVWGGGGGNFGPPFHFLVFSSIMIKFGVLIESVKVFLK